MPTISRVARVPYSARDMYRLICDVEAYPAFLPWCDSARIREQSDTLQVASISIGRRFRQSTFLTRNRLEPDSAVHITLVDGPFRHLRGSWRFEPVAGGCRVLLDIDFEFSSRILAGLIGPVFRRVCDTLVTSFTQRADELYGA